MKAIVRMALLMMAATSGMLLASATRHARDDSGGGGTPAPIGRCEGVYAYTNRVILDFSRLGKPTDDQAVASFNGRFREECLKVHWFASMQYADPAIDADSPS